MAGTALERELTPARAGRIEFGIARRTDDAGIRRLLRDLPMPGGISLSLEREPDYFADAGVPGETKQTIVARNQGRIVCVGSCTVRQRFVNGQPLRVGYLGGLRLDEAHAGRFDILRRGYDFFRELQSDTPADLYFTSIAADNRRARHFLERHIRGMPAYEFVGEFVSVVIAISKNRSLDNSVPDSAPSLGEWVPRLNEYNRAFQFAPCWDETEFAALRRLGFEPENFCFIRRRGHTGSAIVWDQRCFKQIVIRGYGGALARVRPVVNLWSRFLNQPQLPPIATILANAFVSHQFVSDGGVLEALIAALRARASRLGIEWLTFGFAANDPALEIVRRHAPGREYCSRIYVVRWPGIGLGAAALDGRILAPEIALL